MNEKIRNNLIIFWNALENTVKLFRSGGPKAQVLLLEMRQRRNKWNFMRVELFISFIAIPPIPGILLNKWVKWGWCCQVHLYPIFLFLSWLSPLVTELTTASTKNFHYVRFVCLCACMYMCMCVMTNVSWVTLKLKGEKLII